MDEVQGARLKRRSGRENLQRLIPKKIQTNTRCHSTHGLHGREKAVVEALVIRDKQ